MKVLFDINIILDVLLNRSPFVNASASLVALVECQKIEGYLSAISITTLNYLISKVSNHKQARSEIQKLLNLFQISPVDKNVIESSLNSNFKDFEDAVQYYSGVSVGIDAIVTRNIKDYKLADLPVYLPNELLELTKHNS